MREIDDKIRQLDAVGSRARLLHWRRCGAEILALLHERYHLETGDWLRAAGYIAGALQELDDTRQGTSPLLLAGARTTSSANLFSDRHHRWVRAHAVATTILLVVHGGVRPESAAERVSRKLNAAEYRPRKGSQSLRPDTVLRWVSREIKSVDMGTDVSAALVDLLLKYFDAGKFDKQKLPGGTNLQRSLLTALEQLVNDLRLGN